MIESDFRPIVQKKLTDLTSGKGLKVAFEVNGKMKGTSICKKAIRDRFLFLNL